MWWPITSGVPPSSPVELSQVMGAVAGCFGQLWPVRTSDTAPPRRLERQLKRADETKPGSRVQGN